MSKSFGPERVEIRTGVGGRRRWSDEEKGRIVAEALVPGAVVSTVARRHNMFPQQLFGWIRCARRGRLALPAEEIGDFIPVVTEDPVRRGRESGAAVEIAVGGLQVRVYNGAEAATVEAVLRALRHSGMSAC